MAASIAAAEAELVAQLAAIAGDRGLLLDADAAIRSCDPFRHVPPQKALIVRPSCTAEVSAVLKHCQTRGQRIVTHGGRTGVAGGAYAGPDEIVLSLERMAKIEDIDPIGMTATVGAGATLEALRDALLPYDLFYPIDLGAKGSATIGGTLATNAGGNRVVRWGMTRQNVLGVEAVLADGTIVSALNKLGKNNTGYDVKQCFIGSEGTLGVITRVVLKLAPAPISQHVAFIALADFDRVLALLARARRLPSLSAFEVMWRDYYSMMARSGTGRNPLPPDWQYYALIESLGYDEAIDASMFDAFLYQAHEAGVIAEAVTATSKKQALDLWRVREGSEVLMAEINPFVSFDVGVDARRTEAFSRSVRAALADAFDDVKTVMFGHLGDNNIHIGVHIGPHTLAHEFEIESCVYRIVQQFGGALTAEHGVGRFKRSFLPNHASAGALDAMRRVRDAFDPHRLLNREVLF